jgi:hypothetical protein
MVAEFSLATTCVFLWFIVTSVVETRLSVKWNLPYFKSGFPVFRQSRQIAALPSTAIDAKKLESLMPDSKYPRLQSRKADSALLLFREEYSHFLAPGYTGIGWYQRIMHGNLMIDPAKGQIEVIGPLNWSPLVISPALAVALVNWALDWFFLAVFVFAFFAFILLVPWVLTYMIQKKRFAQVADLAAGHATTSS